MKEPCRLPCTVLYMPSLRLLQRRLTLDDFPMEHTVQDARQHSCDTRLQRSKFGEWMDFSREESERLREHGRCRFQTVVDRATRGLSGGPGSRFDGAPRRPMTVAGYPSRVATPTNGPTPYGSVLYQTAPLVLSAIRTRPRSEPATRFNHLRGVHENVQLALAQSNRQYVLVKPPSQDVEDGSARPGSAQPPRHDFVMFVPLAPREDVVTPVSEERQVTPPVASRKSSVLEPAVEQAASPKRTSPEQVAEEKKEIPMEMVQTPSPQTLPAEESVPQRGPKAKPHSPKQKTPPKKSASPKGRTPRQESKPPDLPQPPAPAPPPTPPRKLSPKSDSSSTVSTTSIIHHPRCWVDDASVTSAAPQSSEVDAARVTEGEAQEEDVRADLGSPGAGTKPGGPLRTGTPAAAQAATSKQQVLSGKKASRHRASPVGGQKRDSRLPSADVNGAVSRADVQQSDNLEASTSPAQPQPLPVSPAPPEESEGDEEERAPAIPRFLCPSSERKSRQVATKEWLAKSPFTSASKTVPLM